MVPRRLYLASGRINGLARFLRTDPRLVRVGFVPTAARVLGDPSAMDEDLAALRAMGCAVELVELDGLGREELAARLGHLEAVFITGGNAFHLLHHAILSGFTTLVPPLVQSGALLYAGVSAGAILAGPDLLPATATTNRWKAPELTTTTALGLVAFSVLPHFGDPAREDRYRALLEDDAGRGLLVPLSDEQAVEVEGTTWRVVPAA